VPLRIKWIYIYYAAQAEAEECGMQRAAASPDPGAAGVQWSDLSPDEQRAFRLKMADCENRLKKLLTKEKMELRKWLKDNPHATAETVRAREALAYVALKNHRSITREGLSKEHVQSSRYEPLAPPPAELGDQDIDTVFEEERKVLKNNEQYQRNQAWTQEQRAAANEKRCARYSERGDEALDSKTRCRLKSEGLSPQQIEDKLASLKAWRARVKGGAASVEDERERAASTSQLVSLAGLQVKAAHVLGRLQAATDSAAVHDAMKRLQAALGLGNKRPRSDADAVKEMAQTQRNGFFVQHQSPSQRGGLPVTDAAASSEALLCAEADDLVARLEAAWTAVHKFSKPNSGLSVP
jgi:hypothetical protein